MFFYESVPFSSFVPSRYFQSATTQKVFFFKKCPTRKRVISKSCTSRCQKAAHSAALKNHSGESGFT